MLLADDIPITPAPVPIVAPACPCWNAPTVSSCELFWVTATCDGDPIPLMGEWPYVPPFGILDAFITVPDVSPGYHVIEVADDEGLYGAGVGILLEAAEDLDAVDAGQLQVEEEQVGAGGAELDEARHTVVGRVHGDVTNAVGEAPLDEPEDVGLVVDDQDPAVGLLLVDRALRGGNAVPHVGPGPDLVRADAPGGL